MNKWSLFFILAFLTVPQVGIDLYLPSIPAMTVVFNTTASMVQITLTIYTIAIAVSQLFYGPISDSVGRRPVALFGCFVFVIGSTICLIAHSIVLLLIGRLIQGIGIGFGAALSRAILRDLCRDKKIMAKIVSYQSMTWSTVPLIAPIFGGYIQRYLNWKMNFYILFGLGMLIFLLSLFNLTESNPESRRKPLHLGNTLRNYWSIINDFHIFKYLLVVAIQFGGLLTIIQLSPFIFQNQLGYTASAYGWFIFVVGFGSFVGAYINRHMSQHYPLNNIIISAIIFAFIISIVMNLLAIRWFNAWVIILPILLIRFAGGLTYSNCITQGMHQHPEKSGTAGALFGTVAFGGGSLISLIVAHLPHYKQVSLSGSLVVQLFISFILFGFSFLFVRTKLN